MLFCTSAFVEPTDGFRQIAENFRAACAESGLTLEQAAEVMKLDYSQLIRQLQCRDGAHLSLYRLSLMPRTFRQVFARLMVQQLGAFYLDADLLGATVDAVTRLVGKKPQIYMNRPDEGEMKKAKVS